MNNRVVIGAPYKAGTNWVNDLSEKLEGNTKYPYKLILSRWGESTSNVPNNHRIAKVEKIYVTPGPCGISKNWNLLVSAAIAEGAEIIGVVNDDCFPPNLQGDCWLTRMIDYMDKNPKVGVCSPHWLWCGKEAEGAKEKFERDAQTFSDQNKGHVESGMQGFAFLVRKQVFKDLNETTGKYFDEDFQANWEEGEWFWRVRQLGWEGSILYEVPFFHHGSVTLGLESHGWNQNVYWSGKDLFHKKTGAPLAPVFTFHNGIYHYRNNESEPWNKW